MAGVAEQTSHADLSVEEGAEGLLTLTFRGQLDSRSTGTVWRQAFTAIDRTSPRRVVIDAAGIEYCDGAGIGLFIEIQCHLSRGGGTFELRGLKEEFRQLLDFFPENCFLDLPPARKPYSRVERVGRVAIECVKDWGRQIAFIGEVIYHFVGTLLRPKSLRWRDTFLTMESAGADALPIMILMGFLIGLILAFQSAIPLRHFGAELYVTDLVAIATLRELGPLITAIILAGRTGSAFAAEIGTMKVNEEVDALTTMGLAPVRFLVMPRIVAAVFVTPLLAIFTNLFALVGCAVVVMSMGFPFVTYVNQVVAASSSGDFLGGLFKAFVFGIIVASVGCMRGLQTRTGAVAVGESTTRSVVTGIVLIIVTDGVFSVLFFALGI